MNVKIGVTGDCRNGGGVRINDVWTHYPGAM